MNLANNKWVVGIVIVLGLAYTFFSFKDKILGFFQSYSKTSSGLEYKFIRGEKIEKIPVKGTMIVYKILVLGNNDKDTINNTFQLPLPISQLEWPEKIDNLLLEGLTLGKAGSTVEFLMSAKELINIIGTTAKLLALDPNSQVKIRVEIDAHVTPEKKEEYDNIWQRKRLIYENDLIDKYLAKNKKEWLMDSSQQVYYHFIEKKYTDQRFQMGDTVEFHYEIFTLNNQLVSASKLRGKKDTSVIDGTQPTILAFRRLPVYMAEGEMIEFVVQSTFGYGDRGFAPTVQPLSPLRIVLYDIKKVK